MRNGGVSVTSQRRGWRLTFATAWLAMTRCCHWRKSALAELVAAPQPGGMALTSLRMARRRLDSGLVAPKKSESLLPTFPLTKNRTVPELGVGLRAVAGGGGGVDADAVCLVLFFVGIDAAGGLTFLARIHEFLIFCVDVGAVGDAGDAEETLHVCGGLLGELMGEDVAEFVGHDAGDLVFVVCVGDEFGGEVDAASGEREAVDL